jgi:hypothetical protein
VLAEYNYKIVHRPGRLHSNAGGSSRRSCINAAGRGGNQGSGYSRAGSGPSEGDGRASARMTGTEDQCGSRTHVRSKTCGRTCDREQIEEAQAIDPELG